MLVACLQESKLGPNAQLPSFPGYAVVRRDRVGGGGGLLTLVNHSVQFIELPSPINDNVSEVIIVQVKVAGNFITIANIYILPVSLAPPGFAASILPLLGADTIVMGDVNDHNDEWSLGVSDSRSDLIAGEVDSLGFTVLNVPDIATCPSSNSSPDVVFVQTTLALNFN